MRGRARRIFRRRWTTITGAVIAVFFFGVVFRALGPTSAGEPPEKIVVSAAASLSTVLEAARKQFESNYDGRFAVTFNFGSSGTLQRQVEMGAPVDAFVSAAVEPVHNLVEKGLVSDDAVHIIARNEIVLIQSRAATMPLRDWSGLASPHVARIALGDPRHVPAGQYGRRVLQHANLWDVLQSRLVLAEHVRQVVAYVAAGEVDAGIVYASDTAGSDQVRVVASAPTEGLPPVLYAAAVMADAANVDGAQRFINFLTSDDAQQIWRRHGFLPP